MCSLLKRAVVLSRKSLLEAGIDTPDAIITGSGTSCIENTEKFLTSIFRNGEKFLQPTCFMQSTHNVISSTMAIELKCHGYNNTFVHRGVSFENALFDALMQFRLQRITTALVGGFDELTDDYYIFFDRLGVWNFRPADNSNKHRCFASEGAVSMVLRDRKDHNTLCLLNDVELMFKPTTAQMQHSLDRILHSASCRINDIDAILTGINTNPRNDAIYDSVIATHFPRKPIMQYKHLFGESFSSSALAVHVAATCLHNNKIPAILLRDADRDIHHPQRILLYNHNNKTHTFTLLTSC
jgi:3-oxoacyl-(acyl-carrier-protein) synthase